MSNITLEDVEKALLEIFKPKSERKIVAYTNAYGMDYYEEIRENELRKYCNLPEIKYMILPYKIARIFNKKNIYTSRYTQRKYRKIIINE